MKRKVNVKERQREREIEREREREREKAIFIIHKVSLSRIDCSGLYEVTEIRL